jgi:hypothetical protein
MLENLNKPVIYVLCNKSVKKYDLSLLGVSEFTYIRFEETYSKIMDKHNRHFSGIKTDLLLVP